MSVTIFRRFLAVLLLFLASNTNAQNHESDTIRKVKPRPKLCPRYYPGISAGMNNPPGYLGASLDVAITGAWSAATGLGMSTWGLKTFLEGRHYFNKCNRGFAIGGGFTYSKGTQGLHLPGVSTVFGDQDVVVNQHDQFNAMLSAFYFFKLGRSGRNRFHVQAGFSVPLGGPPTYDSDIPLSPEGNDQIEFLAPGGILLGIGFSFGFGSIQPRLR